MEAKQRILVVDDEPQLTRVLRRSLTTKGYDVRVAGDGEFALQTFRDWPPALVITDLAMPNMSGLELCRRLRKVSDVPIIVLSVRGAVWGGDYTGQTEFLRVFIGQLRKKIEPDPSTPRYLLTEPWIGYRFNPE